MAKEQTPKQEEEPTPPPPPPPPPSTEPVMFSDVEPEGIEHYTISAETDGSSKEEN